MSPTSAAFLRSWPFDPWIIVAILLTSAIYVRGWILLRGRDPKRWPAGKLVAFLAGNLAIFLALASPIEPFGSLLLQVHMIQHLLLMMVAPPLLWLGAPLLPMIRGIPRPIRGYWVAPVFRSRSVRRVFGFVSRPAPALVIYLFMTWFWHVPVIYESALLVSDLHKLQHVCFLASSLLFWFLVVRPWPSQPGWSLWLLLPYLLIADISNTILAALLTFSDRVIYPHYSQIPRLAGISALDDQGTAGVIMWVPGSVAFLVPLFAIGSRLLFGGNATDREIARKNGVSSLPILTLEEIRQTRSRFDLLKLPVVGRFLRWGHARIVIQSVSMGLAAIVVADGLLGTQVAAMNLAGVLPWIHWRGFVILGLLAVGNVSCLACPFLLPRTMARRWFFPRYSWPRALRNKWLSVGLVATFFWAHEAFSLWDSPRSTAWIIVGYFVVVFAVDSAFQGASFCKYLCPIGQFNFVQSLISPLEVKARDPGICDSCRTKECIRGTTSGRNGCELELFVPRKAGNLDCTLCLDCVHVCPHQNIGILAVPPGSELWNETKRSGIGRLKDRPDLAALILVLVFGSFANAAGMVEPVQEWQAKLANRWTWLNPLAITTLYYVFALVLVPFGVMLLSTLVSRRSGRPKAKNWQSATRFSFALVPLGFAMWLSHYGFHLVTSFRSAIPATQRFFEATGFALFGSPQWSAACCREVASWLPRLEIVALDFGLLLSLYAGFRIAGGEDRLCWRVFLFWAVVMVLLFATGVWVVLQPMQMRGTLMRMG